MPQQVPRLLAVFVLFGVIFGLARRELVPESFGTIGHYRADAVSKVAAREKRFAGHQECARCHEGNAQRRLSGNHAGVRCEVCHGPGAAHAADPQGVELGAPRGRDLCVLCHAFNPARPTGFPQVIPERHNPLDPCMTCHDPHAPVPPQTPAECSACHRQIENQKSVSHHAEVRCIACHETPVRHKDAPRQVAPGSPDRNGFCTLCHTADYPRAPQIDVSTHPAGARCWDCHYPHHPEAH